MGISISPSLLYIFLCLHIIRYDNIHCVRHIKGRRTLMYLYHVTGWLVTLRDFRIEKKHLNLCTLIIWYTHEKSQVRRVTRARESEEGVNECVRT